MADLDYRITDISGEQYCFQGVRPSRSSRLLRVRKEEFMDIWHPADCIGEVGAAVLPCMLAVSFYGGAKEIRPGRSGARSLGNDDGRRAALVLSRRRPH